MLDPEVQPRALRGRPLPGPRHLHRLPDLLHLSVPLRRGRLLRHLHRPSHDRRRDLGVLPGGDPTACPAVKKYGEDVKVSMYMYDRPSWTGEVYETECYFPTWINKENAAHVQALVDAHHALFGDERIGRDDVHAQARRHRPLIDKWTFSTNWRIHPGPLRHPLRRLRPRRRVPGPRPQRGHLQAGPRDLRRPLRRRCPSLYEPRRPRLDNVSPPTAPSTTDNDIQVARLLREPAKGGCLTKVTKGQSLCQLPRHTQQFDPRGHNSADQPVHRPAYPASNFKEHVRGRLPALTWDKTDRRAPTPSLRGRRTPCATSASATSPSKIFDSGLAVSLFRDNSTRTRFSLPPRPRNLLGLELQDLDERQEPDRSRRDRSRDRQR